MQLLISVYVLHVGEYFGLIGCILMMLVLVAMLLFFIIGWLLYLDCWCKKRVVLAVCGVLKTDDSGEGWLVGFVS